MKKVSLVVIILLLIGGGLFAFKNISKKAVTIDQTNTPKTVATSSESPSTMLLKQGKFMGADGFHKGSGTAQIIKTDQGNVLKFGSDFTVINGPDLFVYFSKTADENEKDPGDFVSLGKLQSTSGEQTYKLPDNLEGYKSVVIWCRAFSKTFAVAPLGS